ncbi:MAG: hypothetical protein ABSC55_02130 [Syntrophorhabdales bacterium]|jgi:hypothetical protein
MGNPDTGHQAPGSRLLCNFSLGAALLALLSLLSACALQGTPRHSLGELRNALLNHDADGALKYVDVDSIVAHMVENTFRAKESRAKTDLDALGFSLGRSVASAMLPQATALMRNEVRGAIESDDQLGYFSSIRKASVWYFTIEEKGNTAIVTPRGDDKVRFKMERTDMGYWRITELILKNHS